jgi:tetratricopeptide (TPR) repeat protein
LDTALIRLYRDDWNQAVAGARSTSVEDDSSAPSHGVLDAELATSLVEINREERNWVNLAFLYDAIGNVELRDEAIDKAIEEGVTSEILILLRRLQGRLREVPPKVVAEQLDRLREEGSFRSEAVLYQDLSDYRKAAEVYVDGLHVELSKYEDFTLAYYLKELAETNIVPGLFVSALQKAADEDDFWWQVRALEELEWTSELHAFVLENQARIERDKELDEEQRCRLRLLLAEATANEELYKEARQDLERLEARVDWNS